MRSVGTIVAVTWSGSLRDRGRADSKSDSAASDE